jgi:hypothetical protein
MNRGRLLQPYCNPSAEQFVNPLLYFVLHVREEVRVDIKGDGDVGISECLLNHLGVGADREHQGAQVCLRSWKRMSGSPAHRQQIAGFAGN